MKSLFIINDPPYGTERAYNALRLAHALAKKDSAADITVFLMADAVLAAKGGQKTPEGFYNIERMLKRVLAAKGRCVAVAWMRGASPTVNSWKERSRSTMDELAAATIEADKVLVF
jgi:uncharacterized protein involved in oxidation of intracellular sulfur